MVHEHLLFTSMIPLVSIYVGQAIVMLLKSGKCHIQFTQHNTSPVIQKLAQRHHVFTEEQASPHL